MAQDVKVTMVLAAQKVVSEVAKINKAFKVLTKAIETNTKSLKTSTKAFSKFSTKVKTESKKTEKHLQGITKEVRKTENAFSRLQKAATRSITPGKGMGKGGMRDVGKGGTQFQSPSSRIKGYKPATATPEGLKGFAARQDSFISGIKKSSKANLSLGKSWEFAKGALVAYMGVMAIKKLAQVAEAVQEINNRIRVTMTPVEIKGGDVVKVFDDLAAAAIETRQPLQSMAVMYSRISLASKNLNISQGQVMESTKLFSKLLTIQGATAHEARSALLQFSQSLQAGKLAGDEFRSISEVLPGILRLLAKETGEPIESLKSLAEQGQLTPDLMLRAILRAKDEINKQFNLTVVTIQQGMNILTTRFLQFGQVFLQTKEGSYLLGTVFKLLGFVIQGLTLTLRLFMVGLQGVGQAIRGVVLYIKSLGQAIVWLTVTPLKTIGGVLQKLGGILGITGEKTEESRGFFKKLGLQFDQTKEQLDGLQKKTRAGFLRGFGEEELAEKEDEEAGPGLTEDEANAAINRIEGMDAAYKKFTREITDSTNKLKNTLNELFVKTIAVDAPQMMGTAFASMLVDSESLRESFTKIWKSIAKTVVAAITKMIIQMIIMHTIMAALGFAPVSMLKGSPIAAFSANPLAMIKKMFGGGGKITEALPFGSGMMDKIMGGGAGGGMLKNLGLKAGKKFKFFAAGGPIGAGQLAMVGEEGPELFVPNRSGQIIPEDELGGRPMIIQNLNIFPHANIDQALMDKPMTYWLDLAQTKILPALNTLGQAGSVTNLTVEEAR